MAIENINTDVWNGHRYGEVKELLLTTLRGLISKLEGYDAVAGKANSALQPGDIVNGFDSDATDKMLSAAAGKLLKGLLDGKAPLDEHTGRLAYDKAPQVVLASMGSGFDDVDVASLISNHRVDFVYYDGQNIQYVDVNGVTHNIGRPQSGIIYCNEYTRTLYRYVGYGNNWQSLGSQGWDDVTGKADLLDGMLTPSQWPQIVLRNVTDTMLDNLADGDVYFDTGILYRHHASADEDTIGEPVKNAIYFCLADKKYYRWNGSAFVRADEFVTLNDLIIEGVVFAEDGDDVHRVVTDESGHIKPSDLPAVVLDGINRTNTIYSDAANTELAGKTFHYGAQQSTIVQPGLLGGTTDRIITWYMAGGTMRYVSYIPDPRLLYFDKSSGKLYRWDSDNYQLVSVTKKAVASFRFAQATTPNTNPRLEITYTDNTTDSVELAIGGNGSVGPNPQQQVRLTTVEVTEVGSGPLEDAVEKASDEDYAEVCFQWILTDTDSTTGTVFRKVIWHVGGGVFIDAYGTVIYEPEEEENNNNNNDTSSPAQ